MKIENENVDLEEVDGNGTSEVTIEDSKEQENTKTYSEEELNEKLEELRTQINEDNQKAWNKRWGQEKSKIERENAKKDELTNLLLEQTQSKNIDELLKISYEQYGVERPNTKINLKDEEVLGKNDAKEILELDDLSIEEEANRLAGIKRTAREEATFMELGNYLTKKKNEEKRKKEIKENGIDESILDNQDFKDFIEKFNKDTSLSEIYNIYSQMHTEKNNPENKKTKPFSAGSLKDKKIKQDSDIFSEEEFLALTAEDLKNPKIYEKAMKSRLLLK